jgi:hypothetical protein
MVGVHSVPPSVFDTGYADDFALRLRVIRPDIQTVNFGCPSETTITFINGGCPYTSVGFSLHSSYSGPQLSAALAFLQEHPGQVSPITINIGGNDLRPLLSICGSDLSYYEAYAPAFLAVTRANLAHILGSIRSVAQTPKSLHSRTTILLCSSIHVTCGSRRHLTM